MIVESITTGSFYENVWIVGDEISRDAIVIDPGDEANRKYPDCPIKQSYVRDMGRLQL